MVDRDLSLRERLEMSVAEVDSRRLQARFAGIDVERIVDVADRVPARFGGEVRGQRHGSPELPPMLRVVLSDGTGTAVAVFTGRSRIRGVEVGRLVLLEGVARRDGDTLVVLNPAYTLVP